MEAELELNGTVEVGSGRWRWTAHVERHGIYLTYRHEARSRDEMQSWVGAEVLTPERVREAARAPLQRLWEDEGGLVWRVVLELAQHGRSAGEEGSDLIIAFNRPSVRRESRAPAGTLLGELTTNDLLRYLAHR